MQSIFTNLKVIKISSNVTKRMISIKGLLVYIWITITLKKITVLKTFFNQKYKYLIVTERLNQDCLEHFFCTT